MDIKDKDKLELEEKIEELDSVRGRHTELVTVLIPQGQNINVVQKQLEGEKSTASNIKSKQTRSNVIDALDMIIRELKTFKKTPENGLALYAGNTSEKEGTSDIQIWTIEPPKPLKTRTYRCDQTFVTEPLKEMLQTDAVYGLLTMDRKEATIGLLEGKEIKIIRKLTSGVPGKIRAGGQCLSPDTLIMKDNGEIIEIKDSHNPLLIQSENFNTEKTETTPLITKWENKKELFEITTCYPKLRIKSSKEHLYFVRTEKGIEEKPLEEIKEGDFLIMPEKINLNINEKQKIEFKPLIKQAWNMKKIKVPKIMDETFAKILGYYLGDGNYEKDRITFSEQRKEVAEYYKNLIDNYFKIESRIRFRENKGYYQLRVGSRILSQLFKYIFINDNKTLNETIPKIILKSPDEILTRFISGFFDAEGYVSERVALGINNKKLTKQLQFALLRLGIISSINLYDNNRNPYSSEIRYTLAIDDIESIKKFRDLIGFSSLEKQEKIKKLINKRSSKNKVRQIVVNGKEVAKIIRNSGLNTRQFRCPYFFVNKRQLSKEIFKKKILEKIKNPDLKRRLELFYQSNLIAIKISKIKSIGISKTIDIETKNHNFLANGIVVHNSSQRFHRITEGLAKDFFRRVAQEMKEIFFDMPRLKGILIGGPIPTKEEFLEEGQLVTKLKEKVIGMKDLGYVDEHGIELLVEASHEDIAEQEIIKEKKILEKFFDTIGKDKGKAAYTQESVNLALERGAVEVLLISSKVPKKKIAELEKLALNIGSEVVIISTETEEGQQFYNLTKDGIGAILRFALE